MPVEFRCTQCQKLLRTPDETRGQQARCPACGAVVLVPGLPAPPPEAASPFQTPAEAPPAGSPFGPPPIAPPTVPTEIHPTRLLFGDVFRYRIGAAKNGPSVDLENRQFTSRVELQEVLAEVPWLLFHKLDLQAELRQHNAHRARLRAKPEMCELVHVSRFVTRSSTRRYPTELGQSALIMLTRQFDHTRIRS